MKKIKGNSVSFLRGSVDQNPSEIRECFSKSLNNADFDNLQQNDIRLRAS